VGGGKARVYGAQVFDQAQLSGGAHVRGEENIRGKTKPSFTP
jgi:hypothetical protein